MTLARETIPKLPKLPQAQYSLQEQLEELHMAAVRLGLYDADDWLMDRLHPERRGTQSPSKPLDPRGSR